MSGTPGTPAVGPALPWIGTIARLVLGGVFVVAGALKVGDPAGSVRRAGLLVAAVNGSRGPRLHVCRPWRSVSVSCFSWV